MTSSSSENTAYAEVIGDPISHSKSPLIHNFWLEKLGIPAVYRATHVLPEDLAAYVDRRRHDPDWRGCNITIPHKIAILSLAARIEPSARAVGAANCLFRDSAGELSAGNSDVDGVKAAIGVRLDPVQEPVIIGSGGAARSAFRTLAEAGCRRVNILSRNPDRAAEAARGFGFEAQGVAFDDAGDLLADRSLLINASPMGMGGQPPMHNAILDALPLMTPDALVFDMVYAPLETDLLRQARAAGLDTADGLTMLIGQAATAFALFFGKLPPREDDASLRLLLQQ